MIDLIQETARTLRAHALRFLLTSLGIAWGALLLTFLSAQMGGLRQHFISEVEEVGPKLIFMGPGMLLQSRVGERGSRKVELEAKDVNRLESLDQVEHSTPAIESWNVTVRRGSRTKLLNVFGYNADAGEVRNLRPAEGRFLTPTDVDRAARVAFIGVEAKQRLFGAEPAVGGRIEIFGCSFRVIGIGIAKGEQLVEANARDDLLIAIPYTTAQRLFEPNMRVEEFLVTPVERDQGDRAIRAARELTGLHRHFAPSQETALWSGNLWDTVKLLYGMFYALQGFFIVAGTVTLLVGAIGVMNIMLVVVGERTAEIGLRKALGARGRDIFLQFLAEALAIAGAASVLGVAGGFALLAAVAPMFAKGGIRIPLTPDPLTLVAVVGALFAVAVIAGVAPALRAARIPPAEALRAY